MADLETPTRQSVRHFRLGAVVFASAIVLATVAYVAAGWTWGDAFYMVIITMFGVGFGEVEPVDTPFERGLTITIILVGTSCVVYLVGALIRIVTEGEILKSMHEHRKSRHIDGITGHTIICGYGRIGQVLSQELKNAGHRFLVIDSTQARVDLAMEHGWLALLGDAGQEATLEQAHLERATALAAVLPNDMVNVFITLTARNMQPGLRIIARAEDPATEKKLHQAGADEVVLPAFSGGVQIAHRITRPSVHHLLNEESRFLRHDLRDLGVDIEEVKIAHSSPHDGGTLGEWLKGNETHCLVLAVRRVSGEMVQHPESLFVLRGGDALYLLAHHGKG